MIIFLLLLIYFILCEVLVQKNLIPKFLKNVSATKLLLYSLMIILTFVIVSFFVKYAVILVMLSTIYLSVVISNYYLKAFKQMERGKKI